MVELGVVYGGAPFPGGFVVRVNSRKYFSEMIAAGQYDGVDERITVENFPIESRGDIARITIPRNYDRSLHFDDVISAMNSAEDKPDPIEVLLAFGAAHRKEQLDYDVVALGSCAVIGRHRFVPCLRSLGTKRRLDLYRVARGFNGNCRFLVRPSSDTDYRFTESEAIAA